MFVECEYGEGDTEKNFNHLDFALAFLNDYINTHKVTKYRIIEGKEIELEPETVVVKLKLKDR